MAAVVSNTDVQTVQAVKPVVKDYAWGIRGLDSRVARYALESGTLDEIDPSAPYAELWIGTHPKGESMLANGKSLRSVLGAELPFLLKILSAGKALSIQAHPDKKLAEELHAANPDKYGDDNHKPEMAIALTPFEAMCGFRRLEEIAALLKKHPEFAACISDEAKLAVFVSSTDQEKKLALQGLFSSFMQCPAETSKHQLQMLLLRLQAEQLLPHSPHDEPAWERKCSRAILRLAQQFPGDPGAMAPLFLNYLLIAPGESFFMAANEPHAYVAGEIIECMACSDNVVRAGLTPKFKDVSNLVNMLTYTMGGPNIDCGAPTDDPRIIRYTPPVPEFEVSICTCAPGQELTLPTVSVPSFLLVIEGTGSSFVGEGGSGVSSAKAAAALLSSPPHATAAAAAAAGNGGALVMRPGRTYYLPPNGEALTLVVNATQRGPLKVAVAHVNQHLAKPSVVGRSPANSSDDFGPDSPRHTPPRR